MTSIWTPSRELWTPRKPSLLRKVTDWVRMATAGQTLLNSSGQTAMNSSGQELVYDTGSCSCCGPVVCNTSSARTLSISGISGTFSNSGYTRTAIGPSNIVAGGLFNSQTGTGSVMSWFTSGVTGSANYEVLNLEFQSIGSSAGYTSVVCTSLSIANTVALIYCANIPTTGGLLNPGTYPSQGCTCYESASPGATCQEVGAASLTITAGLPAIAISSLPASINVSSFSPTEYFSGYVQCSPGSLLAGGTGTLNYTSCSDNPLYASFVNYTFPGGVIVWGKGQGGLDNWNLGKWNLYMSVGIDNYDNWESDTLLGTYTANSPYCTSPSTITVTA